jgi:hypothetical protein
VFEGAVVRRLKADDAPYFGERALLEHTPRTATVQVESDYVDVLALDKEAFELLLLGSLKCVMEEGIAHTELVRKEEGWKTSGANSGTNTKRVEFKDLEEVGLLGCGAFGSVSLYINESTDEIYALKRLNKGAIIKNDMKAHVMQENKVLKDIASPLIVHLSAAYNWPDTLALLLEPLLGGELAVIYMRNKYYGSVSHARYYSACV